MQVIDAGELTIDGLISRVLTRHGLDELLRPNSAACLVLAREALMPEFFRELIDRVHTIDGTLREHVEFIVFHGGPSTIGFRGRGAEVQYSANGISFSGGGAAKASICFDQRRADALRWNSRSQIADATARTTEAAVSVIKEHLGLAEADLPCLVFVDGGNERMPVVVPMRPDNAVSSLYTDILAPLSDAFRDFADYWNAANNVEYYGAEVRRSRYLRDFWQHSLVEERTALVEAEARVVAFDTCEPARRDVILALEAEREGLRKDARDYEQAKTLEQRLHLIPDSHPSLPKIMEGVQRLRSLEGELASATGASDAPRLKKLIHKQMARVLSLIGHTRGPMDHRQREIKKEFDRIGYPPADLIVAVKAARTSVADLEERLEWLAREFAELQAVYDKCRSDADRAAALLRRQGYDEALIAETRFGARVLVAHMLARGEIGAHRRNAAGGVTLKVLLLTSSPHDQTPLDLEEEMRAISEQIRGARFRDDIELITGPAARPDDVIRLLSVHNPQVVHFSGHGGVEGIVLRGDAGSSVTARPAALERLFRDRGVKVVVLNSCFSHTQAKRIATTGAIVLGTTSEVYDEAARRFSAAFYRAIADGLSVKDAFRDGGTAVEMHDFPDVYQIIGDAEVSLLGPRG